MVLKFTRAQEHMNDFHEALRWWTDSGPHSVEEEIDFQTGQKNIVLMAREPPPARLSLFLGDAIQNLRACLDHLVCEAARLNSGGHLAPRVERDLAYPITSDPLHFRSQVRRGRLGCVPPRAQVIIRRAQPYQAGQEESLFHPLWVLHELSNVDKHRRLPLLNGWVENHRPSIRVGRAESVTVENPGPFKDKAVLVTISPHDADVDVDVTSVSVRIVFGEGTPYYGWQVIDTMYGIMNYISSNALDPLSDFVVVK